MDGDQYFNEVFLKRGEPHWDIERLLLLGSSAAAHDLGHNGCG